MGAARGGKDWLEREAMAGGCPCSCTARCLLDQPHPILHLCKAIPGTTECPRDPFPTPQGGRGPISLQCPGEASRVHSRLLSRCQPSLAPCPGLFSSRDTKAQLEAWHITEKHDSSTAAIAQEGPSPVAGCLRVLLEQQTPTPQ